MAGEAPQLSFTQGEISPEYYLRSDLSSFNSALAKGENVRLSPLGGLTNRGGSISFPSLSTMIFDAASKSPTIPFGFNLSDYEYLIKDDGYVSCIVDHYITGQLITVEVVDNDGEVRIYVNGDRIDTNVFDSQSFTDVFGNPYNISGKVGPGVKGLRFVVHNDMIIFSKTLAVLYDRTFVDETLPAGMDAYFKDADEENYYTETQFLVRMLPNGGARLEANATLQVGSSFVAGAGYQIRSSGNTNIVGNCSYALILETEDGVDHHYHMSNTISGINLPLPGGGGSIDNIIPYPINGGITNVLSVVDLTPRIYSYGGKDVVRIKFYRASGKNSFYTGLYKLVHKLGVTTGVPNTFSMTDTGQEEAAYTSCSDTSMLYKNPSFVSLCDTGFLSKAVGGIKSVVDTAIFQQRAYYAINKGPWWGTSIYNNTIVASRLNAPNQVIPPQIVNPAEAFQFSVPEDSGGELVHLAALSRLVAFTNTCTYIIQGDEAGIISPTAINPYKVLSFGSLPNIPPGVSGETCLFAASTGGVGFVSVRSNGDAIAGYASALASHMFEDKEILSIVPLEDERTFPRWAIATTDGYVYTCYKVGETFSFFRVTVDVPDEVKNNILPMTYVMSPSAVSSGRDININYKIKRSLLNLDSVNTVVLERKGLVANKWQDRVFNLDVNTPIGSFGKYSTSTSNSTRKSKWEYTSTYSNPNGNVELLAHLESADAWDVNTPVTVNGTNLPITFTNEFQVPAENRYMEFAWLENNKITYSIAKLEESTTPGEFYLVFESEVPDKLKSAEDNIVFYPQENFNEDKALGEGKVVANFAFNKIKITIGDIFQGTLSTTFESLESQIRLRGYIDNPYNTAPFQEIPITLEIQGRIYGNLKLPEDNTYFMTREFDPGEGIVYEIDLPEVCSLVGVGIPAVPEIETLPIASLQQDLTDAKKNISYASVILYKTKGLRVGEVNLNNDMLEKFDFTTQDSVTDPVEFSGAKSYSFASTWNDEGRIRVSGIDLLPFTVSGIIPKGNVGSF